MMLSWKWQSNEHCLSVGTHSADECQRIYQRFGNTSVEENPAFFKTDLLYLFVGIYLSHKFGFNNISILHASCFRVIMMMMIKNNVYPRTEHLHKFLDY